MACAAQCFAVFPLKTGFNVNSIFAMLGIEAWQPVVSALLLPPVPLLVLVLVGARLMLPSRGLGWFLILTSVTLLWLSACTGTAQFLSQFVVRSPAALSADRIKELKTNNRTPVAVVVLGAGGEPYAPEYGVSSLTPASLERLRYGIWLGRETGLPVAFSGGVGRSQVSDGYKAEALVAAQVAAQEFGRPLKWVEDKARDTHESAVQTLALLRPAGVKHVLLVTSGWHMPRAVREFEEAARASGVRIEPAPMGLARSAELPSLMWLPSTKGVVDVRNMLRELVGVASAIA
jgi:uncharacterized SAM-binding protein YcdF (DUF218 family)